MSRYQANPNNSKKQQPNSIPLSAYGKAITPAPYPARHDRPNYILINPVPPSLFFLKVIFPPQPVCLYVTPTFGIRVRVPM